MSEAKILDTIRKWSYHWQTYEPGYEDRARLCDANMAHHLCKLLLDDAKLGDVSELQNRVEDLETEVASHARYRELVKSDLAEQSWKKDNDRLRKELIEVERQRDCYKADTIKLGVESYLKHVTLTELNDNYVLEKQAQVLLDRALTVILPEAEKHEAEYMALKEFAEDIRSGSSKGGVFYRERALQKLEEVLGEFEEIK